MGSLKNLLRLAGQLALLAVLVLGLGILFRAVSGSRGPVEPASSPGSKTWLYPPPGEGISAGVSPTGLPYPPPPEPTLDPTIAGLMTAAAATEQYEPPTPTVPPLPTPIPTPIVTPFPLDQPPFITLPPIVQAKPFTVVFRDGNLLRVVESTNLDEKILLDVSQNSSLFLNTEGSWGAPSPDGTQLALVLSTLAGPWQRGEPLPVYSIFLFDLTTRNLHLLVKDGVEPVWSPDGNLIAYRGATSGLWLVNVNTGRSWEVYKVDRDHSVSSITWYPDSRRLVMIDEIFRQSTVLKVVDISGEEPTRVLGSPNEWNRVPQLARDGRQISFVSMEGPSSISKPFYNLWVIGADGSEKRQLTIDMDICNKPRWSPDGNWIVFTGIKFYEKTEPKCDLWLLDPMSTKLKRLTNGDVNETSVEWSPDSFYLIFTREQNEIWMLSLNDGKENLLSSRSNDFIILPKLVEEG